MKIFRSTRFFPTRSFSDDVVSALLALACIAVVVWMRLLPFSLPAAGELADKIVEEEVRARIAADSTRQTSTGEVDEAAREWIKRRRTEVDAAKLSLTAELRSQLSFVAGDGRSYAHLGDYDSYVWLRNARNYLRRGTTCDAVVGGECRDAYGNAPVGNEMIYHRSLHIAAIVALHRAITFFQPGYPLAASAYLVPVLLAACGVLPAFFLGRRLDGNVGAVAAAVVISLDPTFLIRSVGSDNDVWNVVMPLFIAWAVVNGLGARRLLPAIGYAVLAAFMTVLFAMVWRGWVFTYLVVVAAGFSYLLLAVVRGMARDGFRRSWSSFELRSLACSVVGYSLTAGVFASAAASATGIARAGSGSVGQWWPAVYATISELTKPMPADVAGLMGGLTVLAAGWLGLLAMVLPRRQLKRRHIALVAWTLVLFVVRYYLFATTELSEALFIALAALPIAAELFVRAWKNEPSEADEAAVLLVIVWFFASLYQVYDGVRFIILFVVPFGFAFGAFADRLRMRMMDLIARAASRSRLIVPAATCAMVVCILFYPLQRGYAAMHSYFPPMNSAWWETLAAIKQRSAPDAIVNTWWDYGYWVKYAAERRVSTDGGSLGTHVPHWLAKALVASSDAESRGILRMLNCGSDATPLPETRYGAYGKLRSMGLDDYRAYGVLSEIVRLDRDAAARYLAARGFSTERRASLLASTHCDPPESFLVVSKQMIMKASRWMGLGAWDVRRAYLANVTRLLAEPAALEDLARLGYGSASAKSLYEQVAKLHSAAEIDAFIAPPQQLIPSSWMPCREAGAAMSCRITITTETGAGYLDFVYDPAAPKSATLADNRRVGKAGVLVVAGTGGLEEVRNAAAPFADVGVLLDVPGRRILVGSPLLVQSTLVRLFYLDDRYSSIFKSFGRKTTGFGDEVATFKIDWEK